MTDDWGTPWFEVLLELQDELESIAESNKYNHNEKSSEYPWESEYVREMLQLLTMSYLKECHVRNGFDIWPHEKNDKLYRFGTKRHLVCLTATIIVRNKNTGKYLIIKRAHDPFAGSMAFPGGFVDEGEDAVTCAQRELKEETHIEKETEDFVYLDTRSDPERDPRGHIVDTGWFVEVDSEEFQADDDADTEDSGWYTKEEVDQMIADKRFSFDLADLWENFKNKEI